MLFESVCLYRENLEKLRDIFIFRPGQGRGRGEVSIQSSATVLSSKRACAVIS